MKDSQKTIDQLLKEQRNLQRRILELENENIAHKKIDQALLDSGMDFESMAESSLDLIARFDSKFRYLYANSSALRTVNLKLKDVIGKNSRELDFAEKDCVYWEEQLKLAFKTGKTSQHVFEWKRSTGTVFVAWHLFPEFNQNGKVSTVLSSSRDITEIMHAEKKLIEHSKKLEKRVKNRTKSLEDSLEKLQYRELATGLQHRLLLDASSASGLEEVLQIVMMEIAEFFDWEYGEAWIPEYDKNLLHLVSQWSLLDSGAYGFINQPEDINCEIGKDIPGTASIDKKEIWIEDLAIFGMTVSKDRNEFLMNTGMKSAVVIPVHLDGDILLVVCFYSSKARKKDKVKLELMLTIALQMGAVIQRKLVDSKFNQVIEFAPNALFLTTTDGIITYQNKEASNLFGYDDSEILGQPVELVIHERCRKKHIVDRKKWIQNENRQPIGPGLDFCGVNKQGEEISVNASINIIKINFNSQVVISIVDLREQKKNIVQLKLYSDRLKALTNHLNKITERERKSIARDLHDDLGQVLTSLKMELSMLEKKIVSTDESIEVNEEIIAMNDTIDNALTKVSRFITDLRPEVLDSLGLVTALEWQSNEFAKRTRIDCDFRSNSEKIDVNDETSIGIYRIVQECFTNISRHAKASKVQFVCNKNEKNIIIEIKDNGVGISPDILKSTNRFGLLGMRERAIALNGDLKILPGEDGKGTTICLSVPIIEGEVGFDKNNNS